jgi:hypothetical protein
LIDGVEETSRFFLTSRYIKKGVEKTLELVMLFLPFSVRQYGHVFNVDAEIEMFMIDDSCYCYPVCCLE